VLICAKVLGDVKLRLPGWPKFGVLVRLKLSARNSK